MPVRWREQLFARARFGNAEPPPGSALPDGLRLALYNPARGAVDERKGLYTGEPATLLLGTAPAAYANRTKGATEAVAAMRFAGDYYLQLTLDRRAPASVPLALDLALATPSGAHVAKPAPGQTTGSPATDAHSGLAPDATRGRASGPDSDPASAPDPDPDLDSDFGSGPGPGAGPDPVLRAVGIAGLSTGTALVAFLAAWPLFPSRSPRPRPHPHPGPHLHPHPHLHPRSRFRPRLRSRPRGRHARGA
ncbi:hypothetical protein RGF97_11130 [Streptomyces roseicoloratus]|uniref:Uncharacterized protein n=1 Tax=Streptomyces roseicoloratus TaxID=2508722 RepID=A0ABY9RSZ0_9ACTN|nr:hypothetical protein [Streptomyces roseicoloratus]WMX45296.1 hypothetical protein RGF97_11130 [Streptomyces roseicoloratus]